MGRDRHDRLSRRRSVQPWSLGDAPRQCVRRIPPRTSALGRLQGRPESERIRGFRDFRRFWDRNAHLSGIALRAPIKQPLLRPRISGTRIQIEAYPIWAGECFGPAATNMNGNAAQIDERHLRGEFPAYDILRNTALAGGVLNAFGRRVPGPASGFLFLIEALAGHAVRAAFEGQDAVVHVWSEQREDPAVEIGEVRFSVVFARPEDFIRMRKSRRCIFGSHSALPTNLPCLLVIPETEKNRLAQFSIFGPFAEGNLRHKPGFQKCSTRIFRIHEKGRSGLDEGRERLAQTAPRAGIKSRTDLPTSRKPLRA